MRPLAHPFTVAAVLVLSGTGLIGCPSTSGPPDVPPLPTPDPWLDPTPPPQEECNGLDDDGDGAVDEQFADWDLDTIADCVDLECSPTTAPVTVTPDATCTHLPPGVAETYEVALEGFYQESGGDPACGVLLSPLFVLQTNDDSGDGMVDGSDDLDIVVNDTCLGSSLSTALAHGVLVEPAAGEVTGLAPGTWLVGPVPDANGDGAPDYAGFQYSHSERSYRVRSFAGDLIWEQSIPFDPVVDGTGYWLLSVGDLSGDGIPELAWYRRLFASQTGAVLATFDVSTGTQATAHTILADLDLDGVPEILTSDGAFDPVGNLLWGLPEPANWNHALPVQADSDPEAEVVVVSGSGPWLLNEVGEVVFWSALDDEQAAPPCLADIDGDGDPELVGMVWPTWSGTDLRALSLDGTELWRQPVDDSSGAASCAAFDFEGDGRFEILYQDQWEFTVRDGPTGDVLYRYDDLSSGTGFEYPLAVDLDKDGSAEIVFTVPATSTGPGGVAVLGSPRNLWMAGADAWPSWDYRIDNVNVDGSVPLHPPATWQTHNSVHAAPQRTRPHPNLRPVVTGSCVSGCLDHSQVRLSFAVANEGLVEVPAGVAVVLRRPGDAASPPLWAGTLAEALAPGAVSAEWTYVSIRDELEDGIEIIVDESDGFGVVVECVEADNRLLWTDPCP